MVVAGITYNHNINVDIHVDVWLMHYNGYELDISVKRRRHIPVQNNLPVVVV